MLSSILLIIFNLFILESLLYVDNAAVLAIMVKDLPATLQPKALKYGMIGAFIFRGLCLLFASFLVKILWLKIAGGLYLAYLVCGHFRNKKETIEEKQTPGWAQKIKNFFISKTGAFWATVILVEIMGLAFSLDNVFAAVAMTDNLYVILLGVFIGIVATRFVAQWFTNLMARYPSLETSAFVVIGLLAMKLIITGMADYTPFCESCSEVLNNHYIDMCCSLITVLVFITPVVYINYFKKEITGLENGYIQS